jgi:hypothetical protein
MNIQTKASFKKELIAYFRTKTFLIIILAIVGLSLLSPIAIIGLGNMINAMSDIYDELGVNIDGMTEALGESASIGVASSVSDITGVGMIVILLLINKTAGGEQKKRSIIIPRSAGLRSDSYLFPKYIIYPPSMLLIAIVAVLSSWVISSLLFDVSDISFVNALLAGVLSAMSMMLYVCFHITLGTATGRAGMSATVCILSALLLPNIFALTDMEYMYNPFVLNLLASRVIHGDTISNTEMLDYVITVAFALAIMAGTYFIALFAQNARKIDNTGNEIKL